jgi:hypothetical protein
MKCQYCQKEAEWVENKEIYGKNYGKSYMMWLCKDCNAYVGCHNNTKKPLGTLANEELRTLRKQAKDLFIQKKLDGDWSNRELKSKAYQFLKDVFGKEFHFGESTEQECKEIINLI